MDTDRIILDLMSARSEGLCDDSRARDEHGWTPLHRAVALNSHARVVIVLDRDPRLLDVGNNDGWTPLHVAVALHGNSIAQALLPGADNASELAILRYLLKKGADRSARNNHGWAPLHVAAALNHNPGVVERLLDDPATPAPGVKDGKGRTPLHVAAAMNNNARVIKLLLKRPGVDPNVRTEDYSTPLHKAAARARNPEMVRLLLKEGRAAPNVRNKAGCTPLHRAAKKTKNPEIVRLLLENGADPRLKNERGELPVDLAAKNKKLRRTEVYWQLHAAKYLPHESWGGTPPG